MKPKKVYIDVMVKCLCGGQIGAGLQGALVHSLPTCKDYDAAQTDTQMVDLLARVRRKLEES